VAGGKSSFPTGGAVTIGGSPAGHYLLHERRKKDQGKKPTRGKAKVRKMSSCVGYASVEASPTEKAQG